MKKTCCLLILSISLLCFSGLSHAQTQNTFVQSSQQDLDSAALSFTTTFGATQTGYLSYVGLSFSGAPESAETIVVSVASRNGSSFNTELARTTTTAGSTTTVTFLFSGAVPVNASDQIKVTCTNNSQSTSEVNDDPTVSVSVAIETTSRSGGTIQIFKNGSMVVASGLHDYRMHDGDVIPDAAQSFGAFYSEWSAIAVPGNPAAGTRRLFVDTSNSDHLSVRTNGGATVDLESAGSGYATIQNESTPLTQRDTINMTGAGVDCVDTGSVTECTITGTAGTGYDQFQEEGVNITQRTTINCVGPNITCDDNSSKTRIQVPAIDLSNTSNTTAAALPASRGGTDNTVSTDDSFLVGGGATWGKAAMADCDDTLGQHMNYDTTGNALSCGTGGKSIFSGSISAGITASAANYFPLMGVNAANATDALTTGAGTIMPASGTLKTMYCVASAVPGGSLTRTFTIRKVATSDSAITCTMGSAATTCNDTTHTESVTVGDAYEFKTTASGSTPSVTVHCGVIFYF